MLPMLLGVTIILYVLINFAGNPIDILLAEQPSMSPAVLEAVKKYYHLDRPVYERYLRWLVSLFRGDWGSSILYNQPVAKLILRWSKQTLKIQITSIVISLGLAILIGVTSARKQYTKTDTAVMSVALLGRSLPGFWLGLMLILLFSYYLQLLPSHGVSSLMPIYGNQFLDALWHMVLPTMQLAFFTTASFTLILRASMVDVLRQDYVLAARASGLSERVVVFKHALKNAIIPLVTYVGFTVGLMLASAPVTETVFTWPGVGYYYVDSIETLDIPVIMGITFIITLMVIAANLLTDIAYSIIDPRVRLE